MELTLFFKEDGSLSKSIRLDPQTGEPASDSSESRLISGCAARLPLANLHELAHVLASCPGDAALALGSLVSTVVPAPGQSLVEVVTARRFAKLAAGATSVIARTLDFLEFKPGTPGFMLIDLDFKGMPADVAARIEAAGGPWQAITAAIPGLAKAGRVTRLSTSAGLSDSTTERTFPTSGGMHVYLPVADAADIPRALQNAYDRLWLADLGWARVSEAGAVLLRTPVDATVGSPERLVFEGAPVLIPPLVQDAAARMPQVVEGPAVDTRLVLPPLTEYERLTLNSAQAEARQAVAAEAAAKRYGADKRLAEALAAVTGMPLANAIERVSRRHYGELMPEAELVFDDPAIGVTTVSDVMSEPASFVGETLADPLEGIGHGRCKAKVMRGHAGEIIIHSFVHGGSAWRLFHDEESLAALVDKLPPERFLTGFGDAMQDLMADEAAAERLRQMAVERTGGKARPVNNALKNAAAARRAAKAAASAANAARTDRAIMPAPFPDAERRKTVLPIDRTLGKVCSHRRVLRGRTGRLVMVRRETQMPHFTLAEEHELDEKGKPRRMELPKSWGIDDLSDVSIQMEVEQHICLMRTTEKGAQFPVALAIPFCKALNALPIEDSSVAVVHGIQTMPMVIDRKIVAPDGFDEELGIWFAIPPDLRDLLPEESECTFEAVKREYDWLCEEWLCDVAATTEGKAAAIALACTGIVRHLVRIMPIFMARAGQHGTGKTTLLNMISAALTDRVASAAAWSAKEEERRKALFAYMMNDAAMLVFDNIKEGTQIDCPHLAKYVTAGSIADRELGVSLVRELPATTVICLTGNAVVASGDLAPRVLPINLNADRADPRNRDVRREDPIAFTRLNRRRILRGLYMILCLKRQKARRAGMWAKAWWHAVGDPIEQLAGVSFRKMLEANEEIDEKAIACGQLFGQFRDTFGPGWFHADDVRRELLDPEHGVSPFAPYMPDALQQQRHSKRLAVYDFRGLLEAATSSGVGLPPGVPNTKKIGHRLLALNQRVARHAGMTLKLDMRPNKKFGNEYRVAVLVGANAAAVVETTADGDATIESPQADPRTVRGPAADGFKAPLDYEKLVGKIAVAMAEDALENPAWDVRQ